MKNVLISGASGIVGYGILRSLRASGKSIRLIGTTIYEDSVAQGFCDIFIKAPLTKDSGYIDWLIKIIDEYKIDLLIPGIDDDIYTWRENISQLEREGVKVLMNNLDLIKLCKDKWTFYERLQRENSPHAIESSLLNDYNDLVNKLGSPLILKPRHGFGSKGIIRVYSQEIFEQHKNRIGPVLMVQPLIGNDDEEFTTSAYCDGNGSYFAFMTLKRKLSNEGYTDRAEVFEPDGIEAALANLCEIFKPIGPTNFQFRIYNGVLKLLEINPRISSSTSIRSSFGYNESKMAVEFYLENIIPKQPLIKKGRAVRYIDEYIFYT